MLVMILGLNPKLFMEFNWAEWLALVGCGFFYVMTQITNFLASKNLPIPVR